MIYFAMDGEGEGVATIFSPPSPLYQKESGADSMDGRRTPYLHMDSAP